MKYENFAKKVPNWAPSLVWFPIQELKENYMDDSAWKEELNHIKINRIFDDFIAKSTLSKIVVFLKDFAYSKMLGKDEKIKYEENCLI